jgi:hypothetical protein
MCDQSSDRKLEQYVALVANEISESKGGPIGVASNEGMFFEKSNISLSKQQNLIPDHTDNDISLISAAICLKKMLFHCFASVSSNRRLYETLVSVLSIIYETFVILDLFNISRSDNKEY